MKRVFTLVVLGLLVYSSSTALAATCTMKITACIDGTSRLILKGNTAQWYHIEAAPPGCHGDCLENGGALPVATVINDNEWFATFNGSCDGCTYCYSDVYAQVSPPLPLETANYSVNWSGRDSFMVVEQPSASNNYALILEFRDDFGGADYYSVDFEYECVPSTTVPALNVWGILLLCTMLAGSVVVARRFRKRTS